MRKKILHVLSILFTFLIFSCDTEPLEGEFSSTPDGSDPEEFCANAGLAIADAQLAFLDASETNAQALCENLRNTIESVITNCGDPGGMFQAFLDEIGNDCSNVPDVGDPNNTGAGQFSANIDGVPFSTSGQNTGAFFNAGFLNILGFNPQTGEGILLAVEDFNGTSGTFDLNPADGSASGTYVPFDGADGFFSNSSSEGSGTLVINEFDMMSGLASGTFEFVGVNTATNETVTITQGVFTNLAIQEEFPDDPDNIFTVDIDGVAYNPDLIVGILITVNGNSTISIGTGDSVTNQNVNLTFPESISEGTFDFDEMSITGEYIPNTEMGDEVFRANGTITITNNDAAAGLVEGTFEFIAEPIPGSGNTETFQLINGVFSVSY